MPGCQFRTVLVLLGEVAVLSLAACSDSTAPSPDVIVTVNVAQLTGPTVSDVSPGQQLVECDVALSASARGTARATWSDATLFFYAGTNRAKVVDSTSIPASQIQTAWGAADIGPGESEQSGWRISAAVPFGAALVYRYHSPAGNVQATRVPFTCGPDVPAFPQPPSITNLTIQPSATVGTGDTLIVHYVARSDLDLWTSTIQVSGACSLEQTFNEHLQKSSERTFALVVPTACTVGGGLTVAVIATNAALQSATLRSPQRLTVVDHTPPQVFAQYLPAATDFYFVGDTLRPFVGGFDNNAVRWVIWEVQPGGVRDSLSGAGGQYISIPIRPQWAGATIQLRFFARDASGLVSDTLVAPTAGLPIYPTVQKPTQWATISGDVEDLAFDDKRGALYLVQAEGYVRIGVFSLASLSLTESIPERTGASDLDLTPGGDSLILALPYERALGIVDLTKSPKTVTAVPIQSIDTTTQEAPWQVRVGANDKAYVILEGPSGAPSGLLEVDLITHAERLIPGTTNIAGARFERSFDRTALVFQRGTDLLQRYDVPANALTPVHTPRTFYGPLRVDGTGARVTLGLDVYDGNLDFLRRVASLYGGDAMPGSALSKDGALLYHALGFRGVGRTRTGDGAAVDRLSTPFAASGYLRFSPDGNTLVVVNSFGGATKIALMDLR